MSPDIVLTVAPRARVAWVLPLIAEAEKAGLTTPEREAALWANVVHETAGLTRFEERLDYTVERLMVVWPTRFQKAHHARPYAHNPQALANHVYANRLGNGPESSGDGYRYRGRGHAMLTGRAAYRACGQALGVPLEEQPDLLLTPEVSARSATWYWAHRQLSPLADAGKIEQLRRRWNGGAVGLADVRVLYDRLLAMLKEA